VVRPLEEGDTWVVPSQPKEQLYPPEVNGMEEASPFWNSTFAKALAVFPAPMPNIPKYMFPPGLGLREDHG